MANIIDKILDSVFNEPTGEHKLPLWFHWTMRILLQAVITYLAYFYYVTDNFFAFIFCVLVWVYLIAIVVFGPQIRKELVRIIGKI